MGLIEIHSAQAVATRIDALAGQIASDFPAGGLICIAIEEGARVFAERLCGRLRALGTELELVFVRAARTSGASLGRVAIGPLDTSRFSGRHLLLLDDIADEGRTLEAVAAHVRAAAPRSVRLAVLVSKQLRRTVELELDYVGFELDKGWVVGMGMDLDGRFRELDHLALVEGLD